MMGYHTLRAEFAEKNPLVVLTLGALSLRARLLALLDDFAPKGAAALSEKEEPGLHFMLGLVAFTERIARHADESTPSSARSEQNHVTDNIVGSLLR
jgi:hypothetical protein